MTRLSRTLAVLFALTACSINTPTEVEIQDEFNTFLAQSSQCDVVEDCVVFFPECPLGCATAVNVKYEQEAMDLAESLIADWGQGRRSCDYKCDGPSEPACENHQCTVAEE